LTSKRRKNVTLADVANEVGVSAKTVSRVVNNTDYVNEATRQQILAAIDRLGYHPNRVARGLASSRSYIIGLTIPDVTNPFFPELIRGVEEVALTQNYNVLLYNTDLSKERERRGLTLLAETQVDGVIVCTLRLGDTELKSFLEGQPAAVLVNRRFSGPNVGIVRVDFFTAMQRVIDHLVAVGRREIAYLTLPQHVNSYSVQERLAGFRTGLAAHNLRFQPERINHCLATVHVSYEVACRLLTEQPEVNAVVCYNDIIASGMLEACAAQGIAVPGAVAVTGFDDIMFAPLLKQALTTVHVPKFDLGQAAASVLFARLNGETEPGEIVLDAELVIRQSTA
jgi:LacI family transcriptional regulator